MPYLAVKLNYSKCIPKNAITVIKHIFDTICQSEIWPHVFMYISEITCLCERA